MFIICKLLTEIYRVYINYIKLKMYLDRLLLQVNVNLFENLTEKVYF